MMMINVPVFAICRCDVSVGTATFVCRMCVRNCIGRSVRNACYVDGGWFDPVNVSE